MVRLVSCRSHRCYSRHGGHSSARNERITDLVHLLGCGLLLVNNNSVFSSATFSSFSMDAQFLGWMFVLASNLADLRASIIAHRMFYKWHQSRKSKNRFSPAPAIVDGTVSASCVCASLIVASRNYVLRFVSKRFEIQIMACSAFCFCAAMFVNLTASLASLEFCIPAEIAMAHNVVIALFFAGSVIRLNALLVEILAEDASAITLVSRQLHLGAALMLISGSIVNQARVHYLLNKVKSFMTKAGSSNGKSAGGLLSWLKSTRSTDELSEEDTDFEENMANGCESEEDVKAHLSTRRGRWIRV